MADFQHLAHAQVILAIHVADVFHEYRLPIGDQVDQFIMQGGQPLECIGPPIPQGFLALDQAMGFRSSGQQFGAEMPRIAVVQCKQGVQVVRIEGRDPGACQLKKSGSCHRRKGTIYSQARNTMAGIPRCTVFFSKAMPLRLATAWLFWLSWSMSEITEGASWCSRAKAKHAFAASVA